MARVLDLNTVQTSVMDLTLQDDAKTVVHLDFPTEGLVQELQALAPEFKKIKTGDRSAVDMIYDLAAKLINCNQDFIKVTGKELQEKYRMTLYSVLTFFSAYMDFLKELGNQKN